MQTSSHHTNKARPHHRVELKNITINNAGREQNDPWGLSRRRNRSAKVSLVTWSANYNSKQGTNEVLNKEKWNSASIFCHYQLRTCQELQRRQSFHHFEYNQTGPSQGRELAQVLILWSLWWSWRPRLCRVLEGLAASFCHQVRLFSFRA